MKNIIFLLILSLIFQSNHAIFKPVGSNDYTRSLADNTRQLHTVKIFSREDSKTLKGYSCSGNIVGLFWIITSAHCVFGFDVIDVFIGKNSKAVN